MSLPDNLMEMYYTLVTDLPDLDFKEKIRTNPRDAKVALARHIITWLHNKDAADAFVRAASKYGFSDRFLSLFIAHGVGIGANEPPYIGETLPGAPVYEFQPGMVFAVEPLIWVEGIRGGGGVRLEEQVLITEDGPHVMSRAAFDSMSSISSSPNPASRRARPISRN